jgi:hypothetical protein
MPEKAMEKCTGMMEAIIKATGRKDYSMAKVS